MSKSLENIVIWIRMNGHIYHLFTTFDVTESRYDYYFRTEKESRHHICYQRIDSKCNISIRNWAILIPVSSCVFCVAIWRKT